MSSAVLDFPTPNQILSFAAADNLHEKQLRTDEVLYVMEVLQTELDRIRTQKDVLERRKYLKSISHLNRTHGVLPPSMFLKDLTRESPTAVAGGGFADIWIGRVDKQRVCIKVLRFFQQGTDREKLLKTLSKEVLLWRQLDHPNIIPFLGVNTEIFAPSFCLISPWMSNGDIMAYAQNTSLDLGTKLQHTIQIAEGLLYLHSLDPPVVHGDIKGANVLISDDHRCCLADFGLSILDTQSLYPTLTATVQGSLRWLAPEFITPTPMATYGKLTCRDIYAFGCTMFEILTGQPPFSHLNLDISVAIDVLKGARPILSSAVVPKEAVFKLIRALLDSCWAERTTSRPDAQTVLDFLKHIYSALLGTPRAEVSSLLPVLDGFTHSTSENALLATCSDTSGPLKQFDEPHVDKSMVEPSVSSSFMAPDHRTETANCDSWKSPVIPSATIATSATESLASSLLQPGDQSSLTPYVPQSDSLVSLNVSREARQPSRKPVPRREILKEVASKVAKPKLSTDRGSTQLSDWPAGYSSGTKGSEKILISRVRSSVKHSSKQFPGVQDTNKSPLTSSPAPVARPGTNLTPSPSLLQVGTVPAPLQIAATSATRRRPSNHSSSQATPHHAIPVSTRSYPSRLRNVICSQTPDHTPPTSNYPVPASRSRRLVGDTRTNSGGSNEGEAITRRENDVRFSRQIPIVKATQQRVRGVDRRQHEALVSARHGSNDNEELDRVTENQAGSGGVISATPSNKSVASPPPDANHSVERPVPSRHQFKHQTPTIASLSKQKRETIVEKEPRRSHPPPPPMKRRPIAGPSHSSSRPDSNREQKLRDAALEAQRRQELSTKILKYSYYSNLSSRSLSSPLMNPDSQVSPDSHPHKRVYLSGGIRPLTGPATLGTQALTSITSSGEVKSNMASRARRIIRNSSSRVTTSSALDEGSKGSVSTTTARDSRSSKSAAALLLNDSVTASSSIRNINGFDNKLRVKRRNKSLTIRTDPFRPIVPREMHLEDESKDEQEPVILFSNRAEFSNNAGLSNTVGVSREPLTLSMHTSSDPSSQPTRSHTLALTSPTVGHPAKTKLDVAPKESNAPMGIPGHGEVSADVKSQTLSPSLPIANPFSVLQSSQSPQPIMSLNIRLLYSSNNISDNSKEDDGDAIIYFSSDSSEPMEGLEIDSGKQVESTRGLSWADPNLWQVWKEYRDRQNSHMGMEPLAL